MAGLGRRFADFAVFLPAGNLLRPVLGCGMSMLRWVMSSDVVDLRDFYRTGLGQVARRMIRRAIQRMWPDLHGLRLLGVGYATPFLSAISAATERSVALMPASLGVLAWPEGGPNVVTLADEGELPFADYSIDRVLVVHAVETSEQIGPMLKEIWRVLAGGGRLMIVAPNRRGIWARLDRTPFGSGRPYTMSQLSQLLRDELFTPVGSDAALFIPPARKRMILRSAPAWERIGKRWFPTFAGVVLIEATKQIYAKPAAARVLRHRLVYTPAPHGLSRSGA
jgi:SAM-dependent methyltransferase